MEPHSVLESNQAHSNPKELFFDRLRKITFFELVVQVKGGVGPCLWPPVAFYISHICVSLCEHRATEKVH